MLKINEIFEYQDGELIWRSTQPNGIQAGTIAGTPNFYGYKKTGFQGKQYLVHRLIFLWHHGYMPEFIDHADGNKLNNRIENLRDATKSENNCNKQKQSNNKSGVPNLYWDKLNNKWQVNVTKNKKRVYSGRFEDRELAELVAIETRAKFHGKFFKDHHA